MEQFANPEVIKTLPVAERLVDSLIVTVLGMGITFLALILLMCCIRIMSSALGVGRKEKAQKAVPSSAPSQAPTQPKEEEDDGELLAVLTAAISMASGSSKRLIIRSYRQAGESLSTWSKVGIDQMTKR